MAGKGGGAWKVAYADFVTAMMAFFMVMWITAQNKSVKESIAQYFENPLGTVSEARATSMHGIEGASADAPFKGHQAGPHGTNKDGTGGALGPTGPDEKGKTGRANPPQVRTFDKLDKQRTRGTIILFSENSAELTFEGKQQLAYLIPQLVGKPNKIEVRAHTSREPIPADSPYKDEWQLCYARCHSTFQYLLDNGIEKTRLRLTMDGASEPYAKKPWNPYLKSLNSRVEVFAVDEWDQRFKSSVQERVGGFDVDSGQGEGGEAGGHKPAAKPAAGGHGGGGHGGGDHGGGGHGGGGGGHGH